jgi:hypothetical protein
LYFTPIGVRLVEEDEALVRPGEGNDGAQVK